MLDTPAYTVQRLCGSGLQAAMEGAFEIDRGDSEVCLSGGVDIMSNSPFVVRGARKVGNPVWSDTLFEVLADAIGDFKNPMKVGITAENLAKKYGITRGEADAFAERSQRCWAEANEKGTFKHEIAPVEIKTRKTTTTLEADEHPKPSTTLDSLAKLRPVFLKDGIVTAGNASGMGDGAAAVVPAGEDAVKRLGLKPLARIVGYGLAGVEPEIMG